MLKEYGLDVQRLFLEMMLEDAQSYVRVQNIYNPQNFDKSLRAAAEFIKEHSDKHKTLPDRMQISATTGIKLQAVPDLNEGHFDWFMGEFEQFPKRQELVGHKWIDCCMVVSAGASSTSLQVDQARARVL